MTTYKELVQGNVHKQKLSNKKNWDRIQVYKGGNQCFKVQIPFFFFVLPSLHHNTSARAKQKSYLKKNRSHLLSNTDSFPLTQPSLLTEE